MPFAYLAPKWHFIRAEAKRLGGGGALGISFAPMGRRAA